MFEFLRRKLIAGAQKAVAAAVVAGAAYLAGRYPELAPIVTGEAVATVGNVLGEVAGVLVSSAAGYALTYWKANR